MSRSPDGQGILKQTKTTEAEEIRLLEQGITCTEAFLTAVQEVVMASEVRGT